MISSNAAELVKELQAYQIEVERKLTHVARGFAYTIGQTAISKTPIGDADKYFDFYRSRQQATGLLPVEGYARGSWQVSSTPSFPGNDFYTANSGNQALSLMKVTLANIPLGKTMYIGNDAYYIGALQTNSSPQTGGLGIVQPTLDNVVSAFAVDVKRLFDEG